jgi:ATP-dependent Clp protease adaptor protein ClpS
MEKQKLLLNDSNSVSLTGKVELILFNDNINTFDFVIESLVEVCDHNPEQAEQCATIAHHKGKCCIKSGTLIELSPMKTELNNRGISSALVKNSN